MSSALAWLSSSIPAQASATTCTSTPSSAAASAVDRTQQSVETPVSTIRPPPRIASSSSPTLPKVVASTVRNGSPANSSTSS